MTVITTTQTDPTQIATDARRMIHVYPKRLGTFEERREKDLEKIKPLADVWSEIVTKSTGINYSTIEQIQKHSDWRHLYTATKSAVIFPIEVFNNKLYDPAKQQSIPIDGTRANLAFNTYDELGVDGFKLPVVFGFFGTVYPEATGTVRDFKLFQEVGIAVPNKVLQWMTDEQKAQFDKEVVASSHDFAHSQELFIPDGDAPQEQLDWHALMMLSPKAHPQVSISNYEAKAISEHRIIMEELFRRDPMLKESIIKETSQFLASVQERKEELIQLNPSEAAYHEGMASFVSILYLNFLRPGISLDEIPEAKAWSEELKKSQLWAYREIEDNVVIPWGKHNYATPQQISALHKIVLDDTLDTAGLDPSGEKPLYRGQIVPDPWFTDAPISQADAGDLLNTFKAKFMSEQGMVAVLKDAIPTAELTTLEHIFLALELHHDVDNAPNGKILEDLRNYKEVLANVATAIRKCNLDGKQELLETLETFSNEFSEKERTYTAYKNDLLTGATNRMMARAESHGIYPGQPDPKHLSVDGLKAIVEKSIVTQARQ